ncbi:hypothetical protein GW17_00035371, partial [Ensete ventricosum]
KAARRGGQSPCRTDHQRPGHGQPEMEASGTRKGLSPAAIPATSRRGGHPLAARLPMGKGSHRLHRGSDDGV